MKLFPPLKAISITEIEGLRIGNAQDLNAMTGVTVLRFDEGAKAGFQRNTSYFPCYG